MIPKPRRTTIICLTFAITVIVSVAILDGGCTYRHAQAIKARK